jgi:hypothetical protein
MLQLITLVLPPKLMLTGPIDVGGNLMDTVKTGMSLVKLLGFQYKIATNHLNCRLNCCKFLLGWKFVLHANKGNINIITTSSWRQRLEKIPHRHIPTLEITQEYFQHPWSAVYMTKASCKSVWMWIKDVGPAGPYPPLKAQLQVPLETLEVFLDCGPEHHPDRLIYNKAMQRVAHRHNPNVTSMGQLSDWRAPSLVHSHLTSNGSLDPADASIDAPLKAARELILTRCSRKIEPQGFDTLHAEFAAMANPTLAAHKYRRRTIAVAYKAKKDHKQEVFEELQDEVMGGSCAPGLSTLKTHCATKQPNPTNFVSGIPPPFTNPKPSSDSSKDSSNPSGGGSSGGRGGRGGGSSRGGNQCVRKDNTHRLKLDSKVILKDFNKWNSNHLMAIDWIYNVTHLAKRGKDIAKHLGQHLVLTLMEGLPVMALYNNLAPQWKAYMRSWWTRFVRVIKDIYLTKHWVNNHEEDCRLQRFCERGHKQESPFELLVRRIRWIRILSLAPPGTALELITSVCYALLSWLLVLNLSLLMAMYKSSNYSHHQLIALAQVNSCTEVALRGNSSGLCSPAPAYIHCDRNTMQGPCAYSTSAPCFAAAAAGQDATDLADKANRKWGEEDDAFVIKSKEHAAEVYAVLRKEVSKQKGKFHLFKTCDNIKTSFKKLLPWPCRACGLTQHWYNKCNDHKQYKQISKKQGYTVEQDTRYNAIYNCVLKRSANEAVSSVYDKLYECLEEKFLPFNCNMAKDNFRLDLRHKVQLVNAALHWY